jgi:hypothetical protein
MFWPPPGIWAPVLPIPVHQIGKKVLGPNHNDPLTIATIIQINTPNHGIVTKSNIVGILNYANAPNFTGYRHIRQTLSQDINQYQSHISLEFTL